MQKGSGKSGLISVSHCGQEVLARTACENNGKRHHCPFFIGFPANGRTIDLLNWKTFFDFLPVCIPELFTESCLTLRKAICRRRRPGIYPSGAEKKRSLAAAQLVTAFSSPGKRHLFTPDEKLCSFCFSGKPEFPWVPQRTHHRHEHSLRHHLDRRWRLPWQITLTTRWSENLRSRLGDGRVSWYDPSARLRSEDGRFIKDVDISLLSTIFQIKKDTLCFFYRGCQQCLQAAGMSNMEAGKVFLMTRYLPPTLWS